MNTIQTCSLQIVIELRCDVYDTVRCFAILSSGMLFKYCTAPHILTTTYLCLPQCPSSSLHSVSSSKSLKCWKYSKCVVTFTFEVNKNCHCFFLIAPRNENVTYFGYQLCVWQTPFIVVSNSTWCSKRLGSHNKLSWPDMYCRNKNVLFVVLLFLLLLLLALLLFSTFSVRAISQWEMTYTEYDKKSRVIAIVDADFWSRYFLLNWKLEDWYKTHSHKKCCCF